MICDTALISSAINPKIYCQDSWRDRLRQTVEALNHLKDTHIFSKAFIVDSTGFDFTCSDFDFFRESNWLSCYSFNQDESAIKNLGYGYGELLIYEKYLEVYSSYSNSTRIHKISGRYIVSNLNEIYKRIINFENYFFTFYPRFLEYRKYVNTAFFKLSTSDLEQATVFSKSYIENFPYAPLERAFYQWIITTNRNKNWISVPHPQYIGTSGLSGRDLSIKIFPYNIFSNMDFLPVMGFSLK